MGSRTIKTIVLLLITSSAWGQTTIRGTTNISTDGIVSDIINNSLNGDFENRINLSPINLSDSDFEIRFYKLTAATNNMNLRIVKFTQGEWEAVEFENRSRSSKIRRYKLIPTSGYETFMSNLTAQKFGRLPDQSEVDDRIEDSLASKKEALQSKPSIMDGYEFTVEFKIDDKFRVYQFRNPQTYVRYYKDVEEFKNYASIQKIFERDLTRK